jgi:hypothetical protein
MSAIAAYSFVPKKPSIKKNIEETNPTLIAQLNQPNCWPLNPNSGLHGCCRLFGYAI